MPELSTATPVGSFRLSALVPMHPVEDAKLPHWPKTRSAIVSVLSGVLYSSVRLFTSSATKRLPELSTAMPIGTQMLLALFPPRLHLFDVKLPLWPKTVSAAVSPAPVSPLLALSGVLYSNTRELVKSAT